MDSELMHDQKTIIIKMVTTNYAETKINNARWILNLKLI